MDGVMRESTPHPQSLSPIEAEREGVPPGELPAATTATRASQPPPPPPSQILDGTGWPIPTQLIPLWQRADEVQEMLTALSRVKGALRAAQENKDKLFLVAKNLLERETLDAGEFRVVLGLPTPA